MTDGDRAFCNPLDTRLGYQLRRASVAMMADLTRCLADLDLRPTEASVILLVAANPGITQSEVGRLLGIQRANMAPLAARLTGRGIVARRRTDGRSHGLELGAAGGRVAAEVEARIAGHEARFAARLPEAAALIAALRRLRDDPEASAEPEPT